MEINFGSKTLKSLKHSDTLRKSKSFGGKNSNEKFINTPIIKAPLLAVLACKQEQIAICENFKPF